MLTAIEKDLAVLSSPSATEQQLLESLKFLGHWVGHIHQPLHVSFEDDRGSNDTRVSGGVCRGKLHAVWDGCIIEQGLPGDPYSVARDLLEDVVDDDRATWRASGPTDWANESFAITVSREVGYCVRSDTGCWYDADNERLDPGEPEKTVVTDRAYIENQMPVVRKQLFKAGIRLGGLLNQVLGE